MASIAAAAASAYGSLTASAAAAGASTAAAAATDAGLMAASASTIAGTTAAAAGLGVEAGGMSALTMASLGATVLSGAVGAYGAVQQGKAASEAAKYNSAVESQNAAISTQNANIAEQSGEALAGIQGQKTKMAVGQAVAGQGASGVGLDSGSFAGVKDSMKEIGSIDSMTIRSNAARDAYGYRVKSKSEEGQSALSAFEAANDTKAGGINAASTFLGSAGTAASNYQKYQLSSGNSL